MKQEEHQLFKEFEQEIWLYLDNELPEERMKFWESEIINNPKLQQVLEEYNTVSTTYDLANYKRIDEAKFDKIIDVAISKEPISNKITNYIYRLFATEKEFAFGKLAFASLLIIGAIIVSIVSNRPSPVINLAESINSELLEWEPNFMDNQIDKVSNLLRVAKDDDYRKYYKYKLRSKNVDKNLNLINSNIQSLKEELNSTKL